MCSSGILYYSLVEFCLIYPCASTGNYLFVFLHNNNVTTLTCPSYVNDGFPQSTIKPLKSTAKHSINAFCINYQANMLNITAAVSIVTKCEVDLTGLLVTGLLSATSICSSKIVGAKFQQR